MKTLGDLIEQSDHLIAEFRQIIIDIEYWNGHNPNETPMDIEPERVALAHAVKGNALWRRGLTVEAAACDVVMTEGLERALEEDGGGQ